MVENLPPIFSAYPDLADKINWIGLETSPSPLQRLTHLGHDNLWIKRDDSLSPVYGGNKVRRLEFVLADLIKKKKSGLVTMGGIGTNHGLASAIFCQRLNLPCTLLLFDQVVTKSVRQNLLLYYYYAAEMIYSGSMWGAGRDFYLTERRKKLDYYFLYAGGSSPLGTLGAVNGAFELKWQIEEGQCPAPSASEHRAARGFRPGRLPPRRAAPG